MNTIELLKHFFIPTFSNNQKAKPLHLSSLALLTIGLIFYQVFLQFLPFSGVDILGYASNIPTSEVIKLTNERRVQNGLQPLSENAQLASAALAKGNDMLAHDYWAHVSPDGIEPWKFFLDSGYSYKYAGENLARDFTNASSAVDAWMASPSHRDNLLSSKYSEIGIAVVEGDLNGVDTTIIVQLFGTRYTETPTNINLAFTDSEEVEPTLIPTPIITVAPELTPSPVPVNVAFITPLPSQGPTAQVANLNELDKNTTISNFDSLGVQENRVLISPFTTTRQISIVTVSLLLAILAIDSIITRKRKIARIGGKTFAHLAFLGMILAIALIARAGEII